MKINSFENGGIEVHIMFGNKGDYECNNGVEKRKVGYIKKDVSNFSKQRELRVNKVCL